MSEPEITTLSHFLDSLWRLGVGGLALDPAAFQAARSGWEGLLLSMTLLLLGGASDTLGQVVVLVANRVRPLRFLLSVFLAGVALSAGVAWWTLSVWILAGGLFGAWIPLPELLAVIALCHVPLLLGFLELVPWLGYLLYHGLRLWIFLDTVAALNFTLGLPVWQAAACSAAGWGFTTSLSHLRIAPLQGVLWRLATGLPEQRSVEALVAAFVADPGWARVRRRSRREGP